LFPSLRIGDNQGTVLEYGIIRNKYKKGSIKLKNEQYVNEYIERGLSLMGQ